MNPHPTLNYFPASTSADFAGLKKGSISFPSPYGNPESNLDAASASLHGPSVLVLTLFLLALSMMRSMRILWQSESIAKFRQLTQVAHPKR
jgi:hypothetical protein